MKKILPLLFFVIAFVHAQTIGVFKSTAVATKNQITEDLVFPTGRTLSGTGTFNFSLGTLTLANNQVPWVAVNKSGASIADLPTRLWSSLQSTPTSAAGAGFINGAHMDTLAALTWATDTAPYYTGTSTAGTYSLTSFARGVLGSADALTWRSATGSDNATNILNGTLSNARLTGGGNITVASHIIPLGGSTALTASDLTNGTTGSGNVVLATSPTITTPTISTVTAASTTNLVLNGGSSGASLTLGQGINGGFSFLPSGSGSAIFSDNGGSNVTIAYFGSQTGTLNNLVIGRTSDTGLSYIQGSQVGVGAAAFSLQPQGGNLLVGGTTDIPGLGGIKVFGSTASTSTTTGALQVVGGVGIGGATYSSGLVSTGSRFLITGSGVLPEATELAIGSNGLGTRLLYNVPTGGEHDFSVNGTSYFYSAGASGAGTLNSAPFSVAGTLTVSGTGTSSFAGALQVTGDNTSVQGSIGYNSLGGQTIWAKTGSTYDFRIVNPAGTALIMRVPTGTNQVFMPDTTAATSTTTGALVVGSNVGLSGNAGGANYFGGLINVTGTSIFSHASGYGRVAEFDSHAADIITEIRDDADGYSRFGTATNHSLTLQTNGADRLTITATGVVNVTNTTDATTGGAGSLTTVGGIFTAKSNIALHFGGQGTAPTVAAGAGAGTTPGTFTITGHDAAFQLQFTTGTSCPSSGVIATVTFNTAYANAPHCVFSAAGANAAGAISKVYGTSTTTTFVLNAAAALTDATQYTWEVHVIQ